MGTMTRQDSMFARDAGRLDYLVEMLPEACDIMDTEASHLEEVADEISTLQPALANIVRASARRFASVSGFLRSGAQAVERSRGVELATVTP